MKKTLAIITCLAVLPVSAALANDAGCRVPAEQVQPWEAVVELANGYMWTISSMKIDDGCYKLKFTDPGGNTIRATLDPATLDVIDTKIKWYDSEPQQLASPAIAAN
ncbi:MAG: PepSY domain-containing protein [Devosia sp.]